MMQRLSMRACWLPSDLTFLYVHLHRDVRAGGACGKACTAPSGATCLNGKCGCNPATTELCAGACRAKPTWFATNNENCECKWQLYRCRGWLAQSTRLPG